MSVQNSPQLQKKERPQFAKDLRAFRIDLNLTQKEFAEKLGKSHHSYIHYENGKSMPSPDFLAQIGEVFGYEVIPTRSGGVLTIEFKKIDTELIS